MLSQKYSRTIENIDSNRIYIENVRSLLKIPLHLARVFCELGVKEKLLLKKYAVICPNSECQRVITTYNNINDLPICVKCEICDLSDKDKSEFEKTEYKVKIFYKLNYNDK